MNYKVIQLTKAKSALVDDKDYDLVMEYKWHTSNEDGRLYAAAYSGGGRKNHKNIRMHRLIMGAKTDEYIDHINGDSLDNRKSNLRVCTNAENQMNSFKKKIGTSKYKGVSWSRVSRKWRAYITPNRKQIHLGLFPTEIAAAKAYNVMAKELFGEFARLNDTESK